MLWNMYCRHFSADDDVEKYKYRTGGLCVNGCTGENLLSTKLRRRRQWSHLNHAAYKSHWRGDNPQQFAAPPEDEEQAADKWKGLRNEEEKKETCFCHDESPLVWRDTQQKLKEKARPDSQEFIWLGHSILVNLVVGLDMCIQTFEKSSFWFWVSTKTFENDRKGGGVMVHLHWWENSARGSSNSQHDPISGIRATRHLQSMVCVCTL